MPRPAMYDPPTVDAATAEPVQTPDSASYTSEQAHRLAMVEQTSYRTLPTSLSLSLAQSQLSQADLLRAARLAASQFIVKPSFVFGPQPLHNMKDPLFGGPMRLNTLNVLTNFYSVPAIKGLLEGTLQPPSEGHQFRQEHGVGSPPIASAKDVSRQLRALSPTLHGLHLDVATGLGLAIDGARRGLDPALYAANLKTIWAWNTTVRQNELSITQAAALAAQLAENGTAVRNNMELAQALVGPRTAEEAFKGSQQPYAGNVPLTPYQAEHQQTHGGTRGREAALPHPAAQQTFDTQTNQAVQLLAYSGPEQFQLPSNIGGTGAGIGKIGTDLESQITALNQSVNLDHTAYQNDLIMKYLGTTMRYANDVVQVLPYKTVHVLTAPLALLFKEVAAAVPGGESYQGAYQTWVRERSQVFTDINAGKGLFEAYGVHGPAAVAGDFLTMWAADPIALAGQAGMALRGTRLIPGLADREVGPVSKFIENRLAGKIVTDELGHIVTDEAGNLVIKGGSQTIRNIGETLNERVWTRFNDKLDNWLASSQVRRLYEAAYKSDSALFDEALRAQFRIEARKGLPLDFLKNLRSAQLAEFPTQGAEAFDAFQQGLRSMFFGFGPEGSVANDAWQLQTGLNADRSARLADEAATMQPELPFVEDARGQLPAAHLPLRSEIPTLAHPIPGFGLRKSLAASAIIKTGSAAAPAGLSLEEFKTEVASAFSLAEKERAAAEAANATGELGAAERHLLDLYGPIGPDAVPLTRTGNIDAAKLYQMRLDAAREPVSGALRRFTGVNPGRMFNIHSDPLGYVRLNAYRTGEFSNEEIAAYQGRVAAAIARSAPQDAFDVVKEMNDTAFTRYIKRKGYNFSDQALTDLKQMVFSPFEKANPERTFARLSGTEVADIGSARPLLQTQLRNFMYVPDPVEWQSMVDRYAGLGNRAKTSFMRALGREAPEIAADKTLAWTMERKAMDLLYESGRTYRSAWKASVVPRPGFITKVTFLDQGSRFIATTSPVEWVISHRLNDEFAKTLFGKVLGFLERPIGKAADALYNDYHIVGDTVVKIPRAGSSYWAEESMASANVRNVERLDEMSRGAVLRGDQLKATGDFSIIQPGQPEHLKAWANGLSQQLGNDAAGRIALESVVRGGSPEETYRLVREWAGNHQATLERQLGYSADQLDKWAADVTDMAHTYTMDNPAFADAALGHIGDLDKMLAAVDKSLRPEVHGAGYGVDMLGSKGIASRFVDGLYKYMVSLPDEVVNRQPYYRTWKVRATNAYTEMVAREGVAMTPEIQQAIHVASRDFALGQLHQIMFDFSHQQRWVEMMRTVFPFPQHWMNGYSVWGHILTSRSPQSIERAIQLFRFGERAGVIQKDPNTGEYVFPSPSIYAAKAVLGLFGKSLPPGLDKFMTPLSSLTMLASTDLGLPRSIPLVGGLPVPVPGIDPLVGMALQKWLKNSTNDTIVGWLFQYGPSTKFMPRILETALDSINPKWIDARKLTQVEDHLLKTYQMYGADKDANGNTIPFAKLKPRLEMEAKNLLLGLNIGQMFGPGNIAPRYKDSALQSQFDDLVVKYGSQKATDMFLAQHPNNTLETLGITSYIDSVGDYPGDPNARNIPRIPASALVAKILSLPDAERFTKAFPEMTGLLLVGLNSDAMNKFDFSYYSRQFAEGKLAYDDPASLYAQGQGVAAWQMVTQWYSSVYTPAMNAIESQHLTGHPADYQLKLARIKMLTEIGTKYPDWRDRYLKPVYETDSLGRQITTGWDWKHDSPDLTPPQLVYQHAAEIAYSPDLQTLPGIQALRYYVDQTQAIRKDMAANKITDIRLKAAQTAGLTTRYQGVLDHIQLTWPDAAPLLNSFFKGDLQGLASGAFEAEQAMTPQQQDAVASYDSQIQALRLKEADHYQYKSQSYDLYDQERVLTDQQWRSDPTAVQGWFDVNYPTPTDKRDYLMNLAARPGIFQSRFDLHQMGINLSDSAAKKIDTLSQMSLALTKIKEQDPNADTSAGYAAITALTKGYMAQDKSFAAYEKATSTWGWGIKASGLSDLPGKEGKAWQDIAKVATQFQGIADTLMAKAGASSIGIKFGSKYDKQVYALMRQVMGNYILQQEKETPALKTDLAAILGPGDTIVDWLVPESYYGRYGG